MLLYGVGIFLELKNAKYDISTWVFLALIIGIISLVGMSYHRKRQIKSQLNTSRT